MHLSDAVTEIHEAITTAKAFGLDTPHGYASGHYVALGVSCNVP